MNVIFAFILFSLSIVPAPDGWVIFERVRFTEKYFKELDDYYLAPLFDSRIKALEDTEAILKGHYLPMDLDNPDVIILSKFPYSTCFFCGGAGPESVAEVFFQQNDLASNLIR